MRAALLGPGGRPGTFRVRSATHQHGPWTARLDVAIGVLSLAVAAGHPVTLDDADVLPLRGILHDGSVAAAPLCPRDPLGEDSGILLLALSAAARTFDAEELRLLGVVAAALGDVYRALRAAERAEDAYVESLCEVVEATEARSPFSRHSERVRELWVGLGRRLGLAAGDVEVLDMAARLLDLGRVETPDDLLGNPGRLNPTSGRCCAATAPPATGSCDRSGACASSVRSSATTTRTGTERAIPTVCAARRSPTSPASSASRTPTPR